jgi:hypothetical protein
MSSPVPAPDPDPAPTSAAEAAPSPLSSAVSVITTLGPPLTILTALLLYFGWDRSDEQARAMGLDVSQFGFTTQDYVIRSISSLYVPLLAIAGLAIGWLVLHARLSKAVAFAEPARRRTLRIAGRITSGIGLAAAVTALVLALFGLGNSLFVPLVLAAGVALARYGGWLTGVATDVPHAAEPAAWQRALRSLLVGALVTLALFWELSIFAGVVGRGYAQQLAASVTTLPHATAFSTTPLGIEAPGVVEQAIPVPPGAPEGTPRYRTTGLRLLVVSGGRMFLLHDGWSPQHGTVVVLPDGPEIRWQFAR